MELSTPNKNQISPSPLSHFENSPVFNYIESLSPLELVKSIHSSDHTFNSLSLSSSPSVLASPPLRGCCSGRENRGPSINRCQVLGLSNFELAKSNEDDKSLGGESNKEVVKLSTSGSLEKEDGIDTQIEQFEMAVIIPKALQFGSDGMDDDMVKVPFDESEKRLVAGEFNDRHYLCESERRLRWIGRIEQNENEVQGDWVALISNVTDALNFESPIIDRPLEEPKMVDPGMISFVSDVLQIPHDITSTLGDIKSNCHTWCSGESEMAKLEIQSSEIEEQERDQDQTFNNLSDTLLNKMVVHETTAKVDVKGKRSRSKQRVRRRCLVFEMGGAHKKKSTSDTHSTSNSILSESYVEDAELEGKHLTPSEKGSGDVRTRLSGKGIGLHLNALATASTDGEVLKVDNLASELVPFDSKDQLMENGAMTSMDNNIHEDFTLNSPKMKRHKLEHVGVACKRCNCKRSKCLKLYCECFAAGLYCIEPCSCQECFNTPAHEDAVLETRHLIESRNPLAFAPKVIRSGDSVTEPGDEANKTPASARHKRGCNCKKSCCLKKYCECFQEGVGCSSNCRCEGCKNTFGSKIVVEENETEAEHINAPEKSASETAINSKEEHPNLPILPATPRSPIRLPITLKGHISGSSLSLIPFQICTSPGVGKTDFNARQPKFDTHLQVIPEDECPEIQTSNLSPTSGVASSSLNCKRISPPRPGSKSSLTWRSRKLILRSVSTFPSLNLSPEP